MAIRDKLKAKFGRSKTASEGSKSPSTEAFYTGRTDIEYYKPHEIPKSKYGRGRVDPGHQERLDAYSFGDAFSMVKRRASAAMSGTFSPGGTKALSAAPSAAVSRRTSYAGASRSRASSIGGSGGSPTYDSGSFSSGKISEGSDEDFDGQTDDLSRIRTVREDNSASTIDRQATVKGRDADHKKTNSNDTPFTAEDLERAMTRATMRNNGEVMSTQPIAVQ